MSIYSYIKQDHKAVKSLIDEINALTPSEQHKRMELFKKLKSDIIIHSKAEEEVFYQPLEQDKHTKKEIGHAEDEHQEIEQLLEKLSDSSMDDNAWFKCFKTMTTALYHHMDEEENKVFNDAKKEISSKEATVMEQEMKDKKKEIAQDEKK